MSSDVTFNSRNPFAYVFLCAFASVLAFLSPVILPPLAALPFATLDCLPLLLCGLLLGWHFGAMSGILATIMVGVVQGAGVTLPDSVLSHLSVLFFVQNALPAAFVVYLCYAVPVYLRNNPLIPLPLPVLMQGTITGSITIYAMILVIFFSLVMDFTQIEQMVNQVIDVTVKENPSQIAQAVPALTVIGWMFGILLNVAVSVRLWAKIDNISPPQIKIAWFRLPRWMVGLVFVIGLILMINAKDIIVLPDVPFLILNNLMLVALFAFFCNGVGVFHQMSVGKGFLIPLFYLSFLLIPTLIYVTAMIGLLDPIVSMRREMYPNSER